MYRQLLLEKKNLEKLAIYEKLLTLKPGRYNLLWLSSFFCYSYSRTVSAAKELAVDLAELDGTLPPLLSDDQKVLVQEELPSLELLTSYLIRQDLPFRFIVEIVEGRYHRLEEFAAANYVSPSTVRRRLVALGEFLCQFGLHLKLSSVEVVGDERVIRSVMAALLWLSTCGKDLPLAGLDSTLVDQTIDRTMVLRPKNDHIPAAGLQRKIDADIAYYRVKNQHFVKEDPSYDLVIGPDLLVDTTSWGALLEVPQEHALAEVRHIAFRQFFGQVFYSDEDPIFQIPRSMLTERAPLLDYVLAEFRRFIEIEFFDSVTLPPTYFDRIQILRANLVMLFFNYYVFKTRLPFFFLLTETQDLSKQRVYNELYWKVTKILQKLAGHPDLAWIPDCLEDMCKLITMMVLPEYEMLAKKFHLKVALVVEDQYIYNHKMEQFLRAAPYITYQPFCSAEREHYDVVIAFSGLIKAGQTDLDLVVFPYTLDERAYLELGVDLKNRYIQKNQLLD